MAKITHKHTSKPVQAAFLMAGTLAQRYGSMEMCIVVSHENQFLYASLASGVVFKPEVEAWPLVAGETITLENQ